MPYGGSRTRGAVSVGLRRMHSRLGRPSPVISNRHDNEPGLGQRFNQVGRVTSSQPDQVGVPGATASRAASWPRQRPQRLVVDVDEHQGNIRLPHRHGGGLVPRAEEKLPLGRRTAVQAMLADDVRLELHLRPHDVVDARCCLRHVVAELGVAGDEVLAQLGDGVRKRGRRAGKDPTSTSTSTSTSTT